MSKRKTKKTNLRKRTTKQKPKNFGCGSTKVGGDTGNDADVNAVSTQEDPVATAAGETFAHWLEENGDRIRGYHDYKGLGGWVEMVC